MPRFTRPPFTPSSPLLTPAAALLLLLAVACTPEKGEAEATSQSPTETTSSATDSASSATETTAETTTETPTTGDTSDPAVLATCLEGEANLTAALEKLCGCRAIEFELTIEQCIVLSAGAPETRTCTCDVLAATEGVGPVVQCMADSYTSLKTCADAATCDAIQPCFDMLLSEAECPPESEGPSDDLDPWTEELHEKIEEACPEQYLCTSGELIDYEDYCDGKADCPDASDEELCGT